MARVLVIRLSSLGDAAMLVPAICSVAARYPQDRFTVLTRSAYAPLFKNLGFNINVMPFYPQKHGTSFGFLRLLRKVGKAGFSHIADEHDVLRTKALRNFMRLTGTKVASIDKGREEKKEFLETKKLASPLKSSTERYLEVFDKLGFPAEYSFSSFFEFTPRNFHLLRSVVNSEEKEGRWIGIAPFAKHETKIYPLKKMERVVEELSKNPNNRIFLFGGKSDTNILNLWSEEYPNVVSAAGQFSLETEMLLMSFLDVMVSMDSANMHLASLVNTPVVSIWGGTHPYMGFYDINQDFDNAIYENIDCRPCSVYGNTPCERDEKLACLERLDESVVINKINSILDKLED